MTGPATSPAPPIPNPAKKTVPDDRLTFPPFPTPPPGVTVVPFKKFKEHGIQFYPTKGDEMERDGLGILTVPLRVRHDTDVCKTETRRKLPTKIDQQQGKASLTALGAKLEWWEEWEATENTRKSGPYNPHTSSLDRLYEAATDFRKGRPWPRSTLGISANWDQFRLFVGILSNTPVWNRTDKPAQADDSASDDEEVLEAEAEEAKDPTMAINAESQPKKSKRVRPRPPYALYGIEPAQVSSDAEVKELFGQESARKEECMVEFLNDPEATLKVFLSSYMRKQGLIWYDRNLTNFPRLVRFFIEFLIRNRVFPENHMERAFRRSLEVIDLAQKELILTSKLSKALPDKVNEAARACWGPKADGYKLVAIEEPADTEKHGDGDVKMNESNTNQETKFEPGKRALSAVERFEAELRADNIQVVKVDDVLKEGEARQVLQDNLGSDDAVPGSSWWSTDSTTLGEATWGNWSAEDAQPDQNSWSVPNLDWTPPQAHALFALMGPTALPNTHTTGIVEWSVRRIKSFTAPNPVTLPKSPVGPEEDPDAVDIELERRFAKVVLEPWIGWDREEVPHLAHPRILGTSRGAVAGTVKEDGRVEKVAEAPVVERGLKPHDVYKDEITLLVDPETLSQFCVGLGVGATWVQMAHQQDLGLEGVKKKKKKKSKSKAVPQRYWYVDELLMIIPSYYT